MANVRKLFVYGTLRRDLYNRQSKLGTPIGLGKISGRMVNLTAFPAVLPGAGQVTGQVIDFEDLTAPEWATLIHQLDRYEGVPTLYERHEVTVALDSGEEVSAHVYYFANEEAIAHREEIPSGDWADVVRRA